MRLFSESSDDQLAGAIDGDNTVYVTSKPMRTDLPVQVSINGALRQPDWANGYTLADAGQVVLREALLPGEHIAVTYCADPAPVVVVGAGQAPAFEASLDAPLPLTASLEDAPLAPVASILP